MATTPAPKYVLIYRRTPAGNSMRLPHSWGKMTDLTKPQPTSEAARSLRIALGESQQAFAQRTGWAISTVVRYELSRPPTGKALAQLSEIARRNNLTELVDTFTSSLSNELGITLCSCCGGILPSPTDPRRTLEYVCSGCGRPYFRRRKPTFGISNFCPSCGRKESLRQAQQRRRDKVAQSKAHQSC